MTIFKNVYLPVTIARVKFGKIRGNKNTAVKILRKNARKTTSNPWEISKSNHRLLFFQGEKILSRQIVFPRVCFSLALILNTKNKKKSVSNICSFFHFVRQKRWGGPPSPPSPPPVSVRQNMSKCFFAQNPNRRIR